MLDLLMFVILGIIQGLTEPIPVSSSGHILIFKTLIEKILKNPINVDYDIFATISNFGSFIAIFIIFRKEIFKLLGSFFNYIFKKEARNKEASDFKYCMAIILATIPAGIMGIIVTKLDLFEALEKDVRIIGLMLIVTSMFLYIIKDFKGSKEKHDITYKNAFIIGLFQVVALLPGISRSGATIVGGMFQKLKRNVAFDFSFMLYMPISVATMILGVKDLLELNIGLKMMSFYFIGAFVSFIFTYIATLWFRNLVKNGKLSVFSIYCLIVGILVIIGL